LSASQPHVPQPDSDARPTRDGITARAHRLEVLQAELETEAQRLAEARNALDDRTLALDHRDAELLKRAQNLRGQEQGPRRTGSRFDRARDRSQLNANRPSNNAAGRSPKSRRS
jgi:hypothetical protein